AAPPAAPPPGVAAPSTPAGPPPEEGATWVPGAYVYRDGATTWRPGFWSRPRRGWVFSPPRFVWTPGGYVFVDAFWDRSLAGRGSPTPAGTTGTGPAGRAAWPASTRPG